jgi:phage terminase large subunit GpA-like protein
VKMSEYTEKHDDHQVVDMFSEMADVVASVSDEDKLPIAQFAETLQLPDGSGGGTPLDLELTPFWKKPLELLESRDVKSIVIVSGQRIGKSVTLLQTPILSAAVQRPRDVVALLPTMEACSKFSDGDLDRLIALNGLSKVQASGGKFRRMWRNGSILYLAWPVENALRGITCSTAIGSEIDSWPEPPGEEGARKATWSTLLGKRTGTAGSRAKVLLESSPSIPPYAQDGDIDVAISNLAPHEMLSTERESIANLYNATDRNLWHFGCTECGEHFPALFEALHIPADGTNQERAAKASITCPRCGAADLERTELNRLGRWFSETEALGIEDEFVAEHRGFRVDGVASPWMRTRDLALNYLNALDEMTRTGSDVKLKSFFNSDLGRQWVAPPEMRGKALNIKPDERFGQWQTPENTITVVAVVDQQILSYAVCWVALDSNGLIHLIAREDLVTLDGVQVRPFESSDHIHRMYKAVMQKRIRCGDLVYTADAVVLDCGGGGDEDENATLNAYALWKKWRAMARTNFETPVVLLKGRRTLPAGLFEHSKPVAAKSGVSLFHFDVTGVADLVVSGLSREQDEEGRIVIHDGIADAYVRELANETKDLTTGYYRKPNRSLRTETLDCLRMGVVYLKMREVAIKNGFVSHLNIDEEL